MEKDGRVYIASTESELKNGWLKCGMTIRDSKQRIAEGNVASVREKYQMLFTVDTPHYLELEKHMHNTLHHAEPSKDGIPGRAKP